MAKSSEREPSNRPTNRSKRQDLRFTPDGYLTVWGLASRQIEAVRADRFLDIGPFGSGMQQAMESPRGQQILDSVYYDAERAGLIRPQTPEEIEAQQKKQQEKRFQEFAQHTIDSLDKS